MSNGKLNINDWAEEDRPRERLERLGAEWLSNAELLAILIGSGNAHQTAVDLMKQVLGDCNNNLNTLGNCLSRTWRDTTASDQPRPSQSLQRANWANGEPKRRQRSGETWDRRRPSTILCTHKCRTLTWRKDGCY